LAAGTKIILTLN